MLEDPAVSHRKPRWPFGPAWSSKLAALLLAASIIPYSGPACAQEPPPPPAPGAVRITFLPPPLEGTLSAGIYTVDGRLIRTLAREATERNFTVGLNGFITQWDGKDDAGKAVAAGKYFVRGYAVGATEVQGVAFHGNDWLSEDDSVPRVSDILAIAVDGPELLRAGRGLGAKDCIIHLSRQSGEMTFDPFDHETTGSSDAHFSSAAAKTLAQKASTVEEVAKGSAPGREGTTWTIEKPPTDSSPRRKVVQRSADGSEILRELEFQPDEPQPTGIAAAPDRDEIYLLERDPTEIRVRGLRLKKVENTGDGKAVSEWELVLTKSIHLFATFQQFIPTLNRTPASQAVEKLRVALVPNELLSVAPAAVQIAVGIDEHGSFLQTLDGLLLRRVTDTPQLRWATLTTERNGAVSLFQSDGAAVEEYRLGKLDQMMAFDAGEYDLAPSK
jgi:hypothetical protein